MCDYNQNSLYECIKFEGINIILRKNTHTAATTKMDPGASPWNNTNTKSTQLGGCPLTWAQLWGCPLTQTQLWGAPWHRHSSEGVPWHGHNSEVSFENWPDLLCFISHLKRWRVISSFSNGEERTIPWIAKWPAASSGAVCLSSRALTVYCWCLPRHPLWSLYTGILKVHLHQVYPEVTSPKLSQWSRVSGILSCSTFLQYYSWSL